MDMVLHFSMPMRDKTLLAFPYSASEYCCLVMVVKIIGLECHRAHMGRIEMTCPTHVTYTNQYGRSMKAFQEKWDNVSKDIFLNIIMSKHI